MAVIEIKYDRKTYITFPDNSEIDTSEIHIESGSLVLDEILCDSALNFGESNSNKFEAQIYNLTDVAGLKIHVYQIVDGDESNPVDLFVGYVDSCKQDTYGYYRSLVAYDALYHFGNVNVAGWWLKFWEEVDKRGATQDLQQGEAYLHDLRNSLLEWMGIPYEDVTLFNDDFKFTKSSTVSSLGFSSILSKICQLNAVFPNVDRSGILRFVSIKPDTAPLIDISNNYEQGSSEFEGYTTHPIEKVEIYDYNGNLIGSSDYDNPLEDANIYTISDNLLLFGLSGDVQESDEDTEKDDTGTNSDESDDDKTAITSEANEFAKKYLEEIKDIVYKPCTVNAIVSSLDYKLGTYFDTLKGRSIIMKNSMSGTMLVEQELSASGDEYLSETSSQYSDEYLSILKRTEDLEADILADDLINYAYTNAKAYDIATNEAIEIVNIRVVTTTDTDLLFFCSINLEATQTETETKSMTILFPTDSGTEPKEISFENPKPVKVKASYTWDDGDLEFYPQETYTAGNHILTLVYFLSDVKKDTVSNFRVILEVKDGSIHIDKNQIRATLLGQGTKASEIPWDGTLTFEEEFAGIALKFNKLKLASMTENIKASVKNPLSSGFTETFSGISLNVPALVLAGLTDNIDFTYAIKTATFSVMSANSYEYNSKYVSTSESKFALNSTYIYNGVEETIDSGRMVKVTVPQNEDLTITNINLEVTK